MHALVEDMLYYTGSSTIHVRRYNKVDAPEQRKGLVWEGKAVAGVEMGFGTRERWPMPFYAYRMHTHSDASHAWTIDLWPK